jgi:OmpA-OmpF porin, OOP family
MSGLLDSVIGAVAPQLSSVLSSQFGESPDAVKKGVETGSAAILGGMASKAGDSGIMSKIFGLATSADTAAAAPGEVPPAAATGNLGSNFLSTIFGGQQSSIIDKISQVSGLKSSSTVGLMATLAPAVLGFLGSRIKSGGLNPSSFANLLKAEAPSISRALPGGLGGLLPKSEALHEMAGAASSKRWIWPVAIIAGLLIIGALLWWHPRSPEAANPGPAAPTDVMRGREMTPAATDVVTRKLPNGVELTIPRDGVETRVLDIIETGHIDNTKWFVLDRLEFGPDSATLQPSSQEQLTNVANILKAYPKIHVNLAGYMDNAGDAAHSLKLSQDRADAVKGELVKSGVAPDRLDVKGYGQENPVADNATEAGRQQNRRIAMRLTSE